MQAQTNNLCLLHIQTISACTTVQLRFEFELVHKTGPCFMYVKSNTPAPGIFKHAVIIQSTVLSTTQEHIYIVDLVEYLPTTLPRFTFFNAQCIQGTYL
jgi:hypothetical protein